jgi:hypothetical protein
VRHALRRGRCAFALAWPHNPAVRRSSTAGALPRDWGPNRSLSPTFASQLVARGSGSEIASVGPSGTSLVLMPYTSAEARQELLEALAGAIDRIGSALAALGSAYEQLDEHNADRLEAELFGPIQVAYGRAKATYTQFAGRHGLVSRTFAAPSPGLPSIGAKGFIDSAVDAVAEADNALSTLQDSSLPTEVGDEELRAAITETRERLGGVRRRARELERTLGR